MYCEAGTSDATPTEPETATTEPALTGAPEALRPALERRGFAQLTDVQRAVAQVDDGRRDLRISSRTGSGKTVALGFALLERLVTDQAAGPTTLLIAPTRELAMQVKDELSWLFADLDRVRCEVVTGGTNLERERIRLRRRPAVLVGTPGRLLDHVRRGGLDLSSVGQLVLDEADQMLDLGFKDELDAILEHLPSERRTHLVSATFPRAVLELADRFQRDALLVEGSANGEAHTDIEHVACRVQKNDQHRAIVNLLLLSGEERTLIFVRTREDTTRVADQLATDGFGALPLNGDLAQAQRTRTLNAFRNGTIRTLVATDVAARGIDVPDVTTVIHVDLPIDGPTYVHRSGRTGRAGRKGRSVILVPKMRAGRTIRLFREIGIEPRWTWPPTAAAVRKKQLERAEAAAIARLDGAPAATAELRAAAANLLRERDPVEVVANLLAESAGVVREPFDLVPPAKAEHTAPRPERGFARFRINWGTRDGANPRRILAHVCRRGDIASNLVGSIAMQANASTFEVAEAVAATFAKRVQRPDRRDPHLVIQRETFRTPHAGGYRGATRTRQSR
ncbi:MAG TPA: DEAD/DEAH box helicase [bacterium]|nr:DEAD/DEAH box helicase [bacterium]